MIVDSALYRDGVRVRVDCHKDDLGAVLNEATDKGDFVWVGLHRPDEEELGRVAEVFSFHPLAVEDALKAHQRPEARALWRRPVHGPQDALVRRRA